MHMYIVMYVYNYVGSWDVYTHNSTVSMYIHVYVCTMLYSDGVYQLSHAVCRMLNDCIT